MKGLKLSGAEKKEKWKAAKLAKKQESSGEANTQSEEEG